MMAIGINVDKLKTEADLIKLEIKHAAHLDNFVTMRILNRKDGGLEHQLIKATLLDDTGEEERILELLKKRKQLNLTVL